MKKLAIIAMLLLSVMACKEKEKPKNEDEMNVKFPQTTLVNSLNFKANRRYPYYYASSSPNQPGLEPPLELTVYKSDIVDTFLTYGLVSGTYADKKNSFTIENKGDSDRVFELSIKYNVYGGFYPGDHQGSYSHLYIEIVDSNTNAGVDRWMYPNDLSTGLKDGDIDLKTDRTVSITVPAGSSRTFHFRTYAFSANPYHPDYNLNYSISINLFGDVKTPEFTCKTIPVGEVLDTIFGANKWNIQPDPVNEKNNLNYHYVSGDMICGYENAGLTIKPEEFIVGFCKNAGYSFNFDDDGIARFKLISEFFKSDKPVINFGEIKEIEIKYFEGMMFQGLEVGFISPSVNYPLFRQQFAEKLSYRANQSGGGVDTFNLYSEKTRIDYAGLLLTRYEFENLSKQGDQAKRYKDVWMVHVDESVSPMTPKMDGVTTNLLGGGVFNVYLSPARILQRYKRYLSTIFGVWNSDPVLTLSAQENTENQMQSSISWDGYSDDVTEKATEQPLGAYDFTPMQCTFKTLYKIENLHLFDRIRFSSRGKTYDAIVKEVTSTNRLEELEITALLTHKIE